MCLRYHVRIWLGFYQVEGSLRAVDKCRAFVVLEQSETTTTTPSSSSEHTTAAATNYPPSHPFIDVNCSGAIKCVPNFQLRSHLYLRNKGISTPIRVICRWRGADNEDPCKKDATTSRADHKDDSSSTAKKSSNDAIYWIQTTGLKGYQNR